MFTGKSGVTLAYNSPGITRGVSSLCYWLLTETPI